MFEYRKHLRVEKMGEKSRRNFLKQAGMLGIVLLSGNGTGLRCPTTPPQTEGPFYPLTFPSDSDGDLTWVAGHQEPAWGEKIVIGGRVVNQDCQPIEGAMVEIWQA